MFGKKILKKCKQYILKLAVGCQAKKKPNPQVRKDEL